MFTIKYRLYMLCEQTFKTDAAPGPHTFDGIPKRPSPRKSFHKRPERNHAVGELDDGMSIKHSAFLVHRRVRPRLCWGSSRMPCSSLQPIRLSWALFERWGIWIIWLICTTDSGVSFFCSALTLGMIFHILQARRIRSCLSLFLSHSCDSSNR